VKKIQFLNKLVFMTNKVIYKKNKLVFVINLYLFLNSLNHQMERLPNPPLQILSPLKFMEAFYTNYPPEKAQSLLWRWFILSIKDEFSKLSPKEMQVFEDFLKAWIFWWWL